MNRRGVISFDHQFITLQQSFQLQNHLMNIPHLHTVNTTFLSRQILLPYLRCNFSEGSDILLRQASVLLAFESFEGGEDSLWIEKRISYLINDIFTGSVQGVTELCLYLVEVVEDGLLEESALGLYWALHCEFLDQGVEVVLEEEWRRMEVVLSEALFACAALTGLAVLAYAEVGYLFSVLALVHTSIYIMHWIKKVSSQEWNCL